MMQRMIKIYASFGTLLLISEFDYAFRVTKQNRAAGILDNFEEGEKYSQHFVRKFVRGKDTQIMPSINKFFSDPN